LKKAQKNLSSFSDLDFVQVDAAHLPFKDQQFDVVVSCFLFHELPEPVRRNVLQESSRVIKKQGVLALVDSLQKNDDTSLDWGLENFPRDFHEPFYKNYTLVPMEQLLAEIGFTEQSKRLGFFSKSLVSSRSLE
jgi:ubiquinone/menaquinone biosynthesis C-methylase UbiE